MIISTTDLPVTLVAPRGAAFVANVAARTLRWFERIGVARADAASRRVQSTRVAEAAAVRDYAMGWLKQDPRFAADLIAAADRHEIG